MGQRLAVIAALVLVLSLPFIVRATAGGREARTRDTAAPEDCPKLVVVSPHVEQIRAEFGRAFDRWHFRTHATHVAIDWRTPGGTSDIIKQLESTLEAAARNGLIDAEGRAKAGAAGCDVFFGGGSFEHAKMKDVKKAAGPDGMPIAYRMGRPAGFDQKQLDEWFGPNSIGVQPLYDPQGYWIGTALSGFGIVYNKEVLGRLGVPEPKSFADLCDYRLLNLVALADGRQSGSIQTTYDSILNKEGWNKGWRMLREMCGNARYFASSATKPPIDVSQGDAAAGLAIDFYGRYQGQGLLAPGEDPSHSRVGYVDPAGTVYIDADPVSILNGAANFDLARKFVEFCMTEEAQALWQFPPVAGLEGLRPGQSFERDLDGKRATMMIPLDFPMDPGGRLFGPDQYALRRMPIRRIMYEKYAKFFVDQTNPFEAATDVGQHGWRSAIAPMMAAFGIDTAPDVRAAWMALNQARALARESRFPPERLAEMEHAFYAFPIHTMRDGAALEFNADNFKAISDDTNAWKDPDHGRRSLIAYTLFFRDQYRQVTRIWQANRHASAGASK